MPGLVTDAIYVSSGIGEGEPKAGSLPGEPLKRGGVFKRLLEIGERGRTDVESAPGVVFAEARGCDVAKDGVERMTGVQLGADDFCLSCDRTEAGYRKKFEAVPCSCLAHPRPGIRGGGHETDGSALIARCDLHEVGFPCLGVLGQSTVGGVGWRDAEFAVQRRKILPPHGWMAGLRGWPGAGVAER